MEKILKKFRFHINAVLVVSIQIVFRNVKTNSAYFPWRLKSTCNPCHWFSFCFFWISFQGINVQCILMMAHIRGRITKTTSKFSIGISFGVHPLHCNRKWWALHSYYRYVCLPCETCCSESTFFSTFNKQWNRNFGIKAKLAFSTFLPRTSLSIDIKKNNFRPFHKNIHLIESHKK